MLSAIFTLTYRKENWDRTFCVFSDNRDYANLFYPAYQLWRFTVKLPMNYLDFMLLRQTASEDKTFVNVALKQPSEPVSYNEIMIMAGILGYVGGGYHYFCKELIDINYK